MLWKHPYGQPKNDVFGFTQGRRREKKRKEREFFIKKFWIVIEHGVFSKKY